MSTTVRFMFLSPYDVVRVEKQKVPLEREGAFLLQESKHCDYYYSYQAFLAEGGDAQLQSFRSLVAVVKSQWDPLFSEGDDDEANRTSTTGDSSSADPVMIVPPTSVGELYKKAEAAITQDLASLNRYAHAQRSADASMMRALSTSSSSTLTFGAQSAEGHTIRSVKLGLVSDTTLEAGEARRILSKTSLRSEDKDDTVGVGEGDDAESQQPSSFLPSSLRLIRILDDLDVPLSSVMRKGDTVSVILEF